MGSKVFLALGLLLALFLLISSEVAARDLAEASKEVTPAKETAGVEEGKYRGGGGGGHYGGGGGHYGGGGGHYGGGGGHYGGGGGHYGGGGGHYGGGGCRRCYGRCCTDAEIDALLKAEKP